MPRFWPGSATSASQTTSTKQAATPPTQRLSSEPWPAMASPPVSPSRRAFHAGATDRGRHPRPLWLPPPRTDQQSRLWWPLADRRFLRAVPPDRARPAGGSGSCEWHQPRWNGSLLPLQPRQRPLRGPAATGGAGWWRERAAAGRCWRSGGAGWLSAQVREACLGHQRIQRLDPGLRGIGPTTGRRAWGICSC